MTPRSPLWQLIYLACFVLILAGAAGPDKPNSWAASVLADGEVARRPAAVCPPWPLPAADSPVVTVTPRDVARLPTIVARAAPNTTIMLEDGIYPLGPQGLLVTQPGIRLRSHSGHRDAVILDGDYRSGVAVGVQAARVTLADLTIRRARFHLVHASGGADSLVLYNVRLADSGQQLLKSNPSAGGDMNDFGLVACSLLEQTAAGRAYVETHPTPGYLCYTGGIDAHQAWGWTVRDSTFRGIYCAGGGLAEAAIHFWRTSRDTIVERNTILNCARGIGFGLGPDGSHRRYADLPPTDGSIPSGHLGGTIRNNVIFSNIGHLFDTGIALEQARAVVVEHNTVYASAAYSAIDARFPGSDPVIRNNLTNLPITIRQGAQSRQEHNLVRASDALFVNAGCGDLRLAASLPAGRSTTLSEASLLVVDDHDGHPRGSAPDLGAYQFALLTANSTAACTHPSERQRP